MSATVVPRLRWLQQQARYLGGEKKKVSEGKSDTKERKMNWKENSGLEIDMDLQCRCTALYCFITPPEAVADAYGKMHVFSSSVTVG